MMIKKRVGKCMVRQADGWLFRGVLLVCALLIMLTAANAEEATASAEPAAEGQGYRIDQPGTITFTVGVKISGKVEKPQVVIFLPKEKTLYRIESFDRSFKEELLQPLPFTPLH